MKINMPEDVSGIIRKLEEQGFEAYAVGGCVRDTLLGRQPEDWDITTSANPDQVKAIFQRTVDTGIQHGTVTVMVEKTGYEVTTFRIDGIYEDGRHPKEVSFTRNLKLDLERRDFTINAMAYNDTVGLVDCFGGLEDLRRGIIQCVGDAGERFDEDALRMLRAVRFSGQLGFVIAEETRAAVVERADNLKLISAERIRVELTKLLVSGGAGQIRAAWEMGMTAQFLPELDVMMDVIQHNPHHIFSVGEHCIRSVEIMNFLMGRKLGDWDASGFREFDLRRVQDFVRSLDKKSQTVLCVTMLLHDCAKPVVMERDEQGIGHFYGHPQRGERMAEEIMRRLTFDNETISLVRRLIKYHDFQIEPEPKAVRRAAAKVGKENMRFLFAVQYADVLAQNPATFEPKLFRIAGVWDLFEKAEAQKAPLCIRDLEINGNDLMHLGVAQGPAIGALLSEMLDYVIEYPENNKRDLLLERIKEYSGKFEA